MKKSTSCLLFALLLLLNSCIWTQVQTHTITDSVGKQVYHERRFQNSQKAEIYRKDGVYYVRHEFYKVPARKKLYSYYILCKDCTVNTAYLSEHTKYREGMELVYLYDALNQDELKKLLPGARYKEPESNAKLLPQQDFENLKPVAVITDKKKLTELALLPSDTLEDERSLLNYTLMPLTGALYVADTTLSAVITTFGWVGINIPVVTIGITCCAVEEACSELFSSED